MYLCIYIYVYIHIYIYIYIYTCTHIFPTGTQAPFSWSPEEIMMANLACVRPCYPANASGLGAAARVAVWHDESLGNCKNIHFTPLVHSLYALHLRRWLQVYMYMYIDRDRDRYIYSLARVHRKLPQHPLHCTRPLALHAAFETLAPGIYMYMYIDR